MTTKTVQVMEVKRADVIAAYQKGNDKLKETLKGLFGSEEFNKPITDLVKTFDDALELTGKTWDDLKGLSGYHLALEQIQIIRLALNGPDWEADWTDSNQPKYYPWFNNYKAGVGFSFSAYGLGYAGSTVGSRLCYKSAELAEYAGKQFLDIYNQFLN